MAKQRSKRKKKSGSGPSSGAESSGGGLMMSLRGGFKNVATGNPKKAKGTTGKVWDVIFWVLLAAAAVFFMARRF